jgi:hypothetical protein
MAHAFSGRVDIFTGQFEVTHVTRRRRFQPDPTVMLGADTALGSLSSRGGRALGAGRGGIGSTALFAGGSGRRWR